MGKKMDLETFNEILFSAFKEQSRICNGTQVGYGKTSWKVFKAGRSCPS